MKTKIKSLKKQVGATIIETAAVLVIIALVLVYAIPKMTSLFDSKSEETVVNDISSLVGGAKKWRGIRPNYTGISCATIIGGKYITATWTSCTAANPKGGDYTLSGSGVTLTATATGLGTEFCDRVARMIEPTATSATCTAGTLTTTFAD